MRISKLRPVKTPERGTPGSAGIDFFVPDNLNNICLWPGEQVNIPAAIKVDIPEGYALIAMNKSGRSIKGLEVGACVIDSDYQGEIHLHVYNRNNTEKIWIKPGDKLVQMLLVPVAHEGVVEVPEEDLFTHKTERGSGGFGSTGQN